MIYGVDYIAHSKKGWTKKKHKYIDRYWKNGRWVYVYKTPTHETIELNPNSDGLYNDQKKVIEKASRDAFGRYKKVEREYIDAKIHGSNVSAAEIQQLKTRMDKLHADYVKIHDSVNEANKEFDEAKEYVDNIKFFGLEVFDRPKRK